MQFTTASYSQHLFSVRFLPLEKMAIEYNSAHSYFFTWSYHPKPCMCLHFSTQITHHTHTQDERKGDLPKKASHTDTCFTFPMGHLGVKYTKSACGNVHSLKISAYQALSIQEGENSPFKVEKTGRHHHNPVTEVKIMNDNTNQHRAPPDRLHCEHGPSLVGVLVKPRQQIGESTKQLACTLQSPSSCQKKMETEGSRTEYTKGT